MGIGMRRIWPCRGVVVAPRPEIGNRRMVAGGIVDGPIGMWGRCIRIEVEIGLATVGGVGDVYIARRRASMSICNDDDITTDSKTSSKSDSLDRAGVPRIGIWRHSPISMSFSTTIMAGIAACLMILIARNSQGIAVVSVGNGYHTTSGAVMSIGSTNGVRAWEKTSGHLCGLNRSCAPRIGIRGGTTRSICMTYSIGTGRARCILILIATHIHVAVDIGRISDGNYTASRTVVRIGNTNGITAGKKSSSSISCLDWRGAPGIVIWSGST